MYPPFRSSLVRTGALFVTWSACCLGLTGWAAAVDVDAPQQMPLFVAGEGDYHTYRIPALVVSQRGTLLAFCEGRRSGRGDSGNIDLLLRRSFDGGRTWQEVQVVWDDGPNTIGNPCPVVDRASGTIWLPLTRNLGHDNERAIKAGTAEGTREAWITYSRDDGATWATPVDITRQVKPSDWGWYATGPGCGIQSARGRLLIPCDHSVLGSQEYRSHVIYSDDGGQSWQLGGAIGPRMNECQMIERTDGELLMNMRSYREEHCRAIATSRDGGLTWSSPQPDRALIEPVCQASLIRYTDARQHDRDRLVFANPASRRREKLTVRLSYDEGRTWPVAQPLWEGPAAYSALAALEDGTLVCLYERGEQGPYETLTLARFGIDWLSDGADHRADLAP